jgi:tungstate transport system substrate-binding protein
VRRLGATLAVAALILSGCALDGGRVIVAAGTTVADSGLLDRVAATFEATHPRIKISVVGQPTRLALELGSDGTADLTITHAPAQEAEYVAAGYAAAQERVFTSRFVLVGPAELKEAYQGRELPEVLREIAASSQAFVSRGDGSGTYEKEVENWQEAGVDPSGQPWYLVTGQGMGPTLVVADQSRAVTLAEYGAYLTATETLSIVDLALNPVGLGNPYTVMVSAASPQGEAAMIFFEWLRSPEGRVAIEAANRELFGEIIYQP